jgi:hypothetical protein
MFFLGFRFESKKNDYRVSKVNTTKGNMVMSHHMVPLAGGPTLGHCLFMSWIISSVFKYENEHHSSAIGNESTSIVQDCNEAFKLVCCSLNYFKYEALLIVLFQTVSARFNICSASNKHSFQIFRLDLIFV